MLSSFLDTLLKVSKTTSPQKLFAYDCVTLYVYSLTSAGYDLPKDDRSSLGLSWVCLIFPQLSAYLCK